MRSRSTEDPRDIYRDALVVLDAARGINNGQPSLWAQLFDHLHVSAGERVLHLGCGTGYYSAILAELTGPQGAVTAVEIDDRLAAMARTALEPWPQACVVAADGAAYPPGPRDAIVASAGVSRILPSWLDALNPAGRLLVPLTDAARSGAMLLVTRHATDVFAAQFVCPVGFIPFSGARDPDVDRRLALASDRNDTATVKSLRREAHAEDETCWLHADGWCLSRREPKE